MGKMELLNLIVYLLYSRRVESLIDVEGASDFRLLMSTVRFHCWYGVWRG